MVMYLKIMEPRVISLLMELSAETVVAIDNKLAKQESLSHVLGAEEKYHPF